jgi:DNA polymerase-3 subunit gamma/tau
VQFAPEAIADEAERARLAGHAQRFDAEFLQLCYQIAINGRSDLALAPDEYSGFLMTLLRLWLSIRKPAGARRRHAARSPRVRAVAPAAPKLRRPLRFQTRFDVANGHPVAGRRRHAAP